MKMLELNNVTLYEVQKKIKPKIADIAAVLFDDDSTITTIQDFNTWLQSNKLSVTWASFNVWDIKCQGKRVCRIKVNKDVVDSWCIDFETGMLDNALFGERIMSIVWKNIKYCANCSCCMPGHRFDIFGRTFDRACFRAIALHSPDIEAINAAKQLIEFICDFIRSGCKIVNDSSAPNPAHVAQQQKVAKIEDYIPRCLDSSMKKISLDFISHLQANKIKPKFKMFNWWEANYKDLICKIRLPYHHQKPMFSWAVGIYLNHMDIYEHEIINEGLQNIIWDNLTLCKGCHFSCAPGIGANVLGKEMEGICAHCPYTVTWVYDPSEATLAGIQKLLALEMKARDNLIN